MRGAQALKETLAEGRFNGIFCQLYNERQDIAADRFCRLIDGFTSRYGDGGIRLFSAPGRVEVAGNHTDHNNGLVLAGAIDLDIIAAAALSPDNVIRVASDGYDEFTVDPSRAAPDPSEAGKPEALARGMAAGLGVRGGLNIYVMSSVFPGSGLSSSAAFETLMGVVMDTMLGGGRASQTEIAKIAQRAENLYFGKPCGLMDQMACALGGLIAIDFARPDCPAVTAVPSAFGHDLCMVGPIGSHSGLTGAYAAIPGEMKLAAKALGVSVLREAEPSVFFDALPGLMGTVPDRAILRAMHYYEENTRVAGQADALRRGDAETFLRLVNESGRSSAMYLQNVHTASDQRLAIALAASERALNGRGACRVHGGGFAGTILAFVPADMTAAYTLEMERLFGPGVCRVLAIRPVGAIEITPDCPYKINGDSSKLY